MNRIVRCYARTSQAEAGDFLVRLHTSPNPSSSMPSGKWWHHRVNIAGAHEEPLGIFVSEIAPEHAQPFNRTIRNNFDKGIIALLCMFPRPAHMRLDFSRVLYRLPANKPDPKTR